MDKIANFIVIAIKTRTTRTFDTQEQVDKFLFGRVRSQWAVYQLQPMPKIVVNIS